MKVFSLALGLILCMLACKEKISLETEVIAIHDEVMPKMGNMHMAKKSLKEILSETSDSIVKIEILSLIKALEDADEGMMQWMADWKVPEQEPEKTKYLENEKEKITKVKTDMLSSLEDAHKFLSKK